MSTKKASPPKRTSPKDQNRNDKPKRPGKLVSMLAHFAQGKKLHRFQAERLADHCLHTTVSDLQRKHLIYFNRKMVKVPNRFGSETSVMLYWLEGKDLEAAREIVSDLLNVQEVAA